MNNKDYESMLNAINDKFNKMITLVYTNFEEDITNISQNILQDFIEKKTYQGQILVLTMENKKVSEFNLTYISERNIVTKVHDGSFYILKNFHRINFVDFIPEWVNITESGINPTAKQIVKQNLSTILNNVNMFLPLYEEATFKGQKLVFNNGGDTPNLFLYLDSASPFAFYENLTTHETFYLSNATTLGGSNNPKWQKLAYDDEVVKKEKDQTITSKKTFIPVQDFLNGINVNGSKITSVGDGVNDEDAVNVKQLNEKFSQFEFIKILEILPEVGVENIIYIVPSQVPSETNKYDEFIWVESIQKFEPFGSGVTLDINLDDYYKKVTGVNINDNSVIVGNDDIMIEPNKIEYTGVDEGLIKNFKLEIIREDNDRVYTKINENKIELGSSIIRSMLNGSGLYFGSHISEEFTTSFTSSGLLTENSGKKTKVDEWGVLIEKDDRRGSGFSDLQAETLDFGEIENDEIVTTYGKEGITKLGTPGLIKNFTIENNFTAFSTNLGNSLTFKHNLGDLNSRFDLGFYIGEENNPDMGFDKKVTEIKSHHINLVNYDDEQDILNDLTIRDKFISFRDNVNGVRSRFDSTSLQITDTTNDKKINVGSSKIEYTGVDKGLIKNFNIEIESIISDKQGKITIDEFGIKHEFEGIDGNAYRFPNIRGFDFFGTSDAGEKPFDSKSYTNIINGVLELKFDNHTFDFKSEGIVVKKKDNKYLSSESKYDSDKIQQTHITTEWKPIGFLLDSKGLENQDKSENGLIKGYNFDNNNVIINEDGIEFIGTGKGQLINFDVGGADISQLYGGKNIGPDLIGKENLGKGEYSINNYLTYNIYSGIYTLNKNDDFSGYIHISSIDNTLGDITIQGWVINGVNQSMLDIMVRPPNNPYVVIGGGTSYNYVSKTLTTETSFDIYLDASDTFNDFQFKIQIEKGSVPTPYTLPMYATPELLDTKVDKTGLKTINGESLIGEGDIKIDVSGGGGSGESFDLTLFPYMTFASLLYYRNSNNLFKDAWENSLNVQDLNIDSYPNHMTEGIIIPYGTEIIESKGINNKKSFSNAQNNQPLILPNTLTEVGMDCFNGWNKNDTILVLPKSLKKTGLFSFNGWSNNNKPLLINDGIEYIGNQTFSGWYRNEFPIIIPKSIKEIGKSSFGGWNKTPFCIIERESQPILVNSDAFKDINGNNFPIYVKNKNLYNSDNWYAINDRLKNISEMTEEHRDILLKTKSILESYK